MTEREGRERRDGRDGSEPQRPASGRHGTGKPGSPGRYSSIPSSVAAATPGPGPAGSPALVLSGPRPPSTLTLILRLAAPPIVLVILATLVLAAILSRFEGSRSLAVNAWLLVVGGLVLWFCWRVLASAFPIHGDSAFDSVREHPVEPPTRLPNVIELESVLLDAEWNWSGVEHRLRPVIRRIASARLIEKHQVDLMSQPEEARRILGEDLWALAGPDPLIQPAAEPQAPSHQRGMPRAQIRRAIELLEAL